MHCLGGGKDYFHLVEGVEVRTFYVMKDFFDLPKTIFNIFISNTDKQFEASFTELLIYVFPVNMGGQKDFIEEVGEGGISSHCFRGKQFFYTFSKPYN